MKEIEKFNKDVGAVREYLREGDCTDMVTSSDGDGWHTESLVQAIRSPSAILVPVINVKNDSGYNDEECELGVNEHWKLDPHTVDEIKVTVPHDFGPVVDMFEVQNGAILNVSASLTEAVSPERLGVGYFGGGGEGLSTQSVTLDGIHMNQDLSTRLFVLANTHAVRQDIQNKLK